MADFHQKLHYAEQKKNDLCNDHTRLKNMHYRILLPQRPWITGISYRSFLVKPPLKLAIYKALLS